MIRVLFSCNKKFAQIEFNVQMRRFILNRVKSGLSVKSLKMINFCKNSDCPASQKLLAFQNGDSMEKESLRIRKHLETCDFCQAEVELYAHYQPSEELCQETEMPAPLRELAQALLGSRQVSFVALQDLFEKSGKLKLEKV